MTFRAGSPPSVAAVPRARRASTDGLPIDVLGHHPTDPGRHLDSYLAAVARELQIRGVITGTPQRTDSAQRLLGSIVLDCTALRIAAWTPTDQPFGRQSLGRAIHPERPMPVNVTWDEDMGWCAALHHDSTPAARRYLHPDLLPTPDAVADFVVGLTLGQPLGSTNPITVRTPGRPQLRLIR